MLTRCPAVATGQPKPGRNWSRAKDIDVIRTVKPADLLADEGSDLAFAVALEIYGRLGWEDAPGDKIAEQQRKLQEPENV